MTEDRQLTPHFKLSEFDCKNGERVPPGLQPNTLKLALALEELRAYLGLPITIMSGYRTAAYNKACGGAPQSRHVQADGADLQVKGVSPDTVADAIEHLIAAGKMPQGGIGRYSGWCHYDTRGRKARWDSRVTGKRG